MPHLLKNSALLFVFFPALLNAQSYHGRMRQGDRLYDEKSWNAAETAYRKAGTGATAWYNVGNAAYQQGKYEAAAESFKKATVATTKEASSDAFYNLGNALMQQGKYKEAIAAYENSLRRQPNRFDAKKNLQIAKKKLKEQQAPPPPPPPPTPPPPPPPKPRRRYLDQALEPPKTETPVDNISPDAARQILTAIVDPDEQRSAREYRKLAPSTAPSRVKKDW